MVTAGGGRGELVSVVIPAFNAEATLSATLRSVRAQTHGNLEITVVDDGSADGTLALAEAAAREDPRIRVLSRPNGGPAAARNAGIRASRGAFLAPVDADDLWHPEKIARQMAAMRAGGPEMGFVYTGYRRMDADGRAVPTEPTVFVSGRVFLRHLVFNFVGNGSSLLIRREAFDAVGGYEPDPGVQGCEDWLLQILIARSWTVGVVPEYLTGYRALPTSLSANPDRMHRSYLRLLEHVRARHPETPPDVLAVTEAAIRSRQGVLQLLGRRRPREAGAALLGALRCAPGPAARVAGRAFRKYLRSLGRRRLPGVLSRRLLAPPPRPEKFVPFLEMDLAAGPGGTGADPLLPLFGALEAREEAFFRRHPAKPPRADGAETGGAAAAEGPGRPAAAPE